MADEKTQSAERSLEHEHLSRLSHVWFLRQAPADILSLISAFSEQLAFVLAHWICGICDHGEGSD